MWRMDANDLRASCLRHAGAIEDFPFGPEHSVFKVAGKMFALSALDRTPLEVSAKCEPELAVGLRNSYPAIRPGYHLNKRHWNTITLDGSLPDQLVRDMIEDRTTSSSALSRNACARSSGGRPEPTSRDRRRPHECLDEPVRVDLRAGMARPTTCSRGTPGPERSGCSRQG